MSWCSRHRSQDAYRRISCLRYRTSRIYLGTCASTHRGACFGLRWLRGELDDEQAVVVEERLSDSGPLATHPAALCSQSPLPSQDSDLEMGCSALLALREADTQVDMEVDVKRSVIGCPDFCRPLLTFVDQYICKRCRDAIGCTFDDYDQMMEHAFATFRQATAAAASENERIQQSIERLRQQLQECEEMHNRAIMSDACFDTVHRSLCSELQIKEEELANTAKAITIGGDSLGQYRKAMMFVLRSVAEGCSRKRPRVH